MGKAKRELTKLKRFSCFRSRTKLHLFKALVQPHLDYSPIPTITVTINNMQKIQLIQNKALRWINFDVPTYHTTAKTLHEKYNLMPCNQFIYIQAFHAWEKLIHLCSERVQEMTIEQHISMVAKWLCKRGRNPT